MAQRPVLKAILIGGLIGGALDLLFAIFFAGYNGAAPSRVFQTVASGLIGDAAFAGGSGIAALGVGCHFALSVCWAVVFAIAAWQLPALARRPFVAGLAFGLIVLFVHAAARAAAVGLSSPSHVQAAGHGLGSAVAYVLVRRPHCHDCQPCNQGPQT